MTPRALERQAAIAFAVVSLSIAILVFELAGGLAHGAGRPLGVTLRLAGGWAMAAIVLSWITFGGGRGSQARLKALLATSAFAAPLGLFAWMQRFHGSYAEPFEAAGHHCLALTLAIAPIPFAGFQDQLHRRARRGHAGPLGAAAAATCGAWASILVELSVPAHERGARAARSRRADGACSSPGGALIAGGRTDARDA